MKVLTRKRRRLTASTTELQAFQTCKRRWYLSRVYTSTTDAPALVFGNLIHKGLEGYFTAKKQQPKDPSFWKAAMIAYYIESVEEQRELAASQYGFIWEQAEVAFDDLFRIGQKILENYVEYDKTADIPIYPRLVEKRIFLPMDEEGSNVLSMRWDVMGHTSNGMSVIVDHKTTSGSIVTKGQILDLDEQGTSYAYGYYRIHNKEKKIDYVIWDTIAKEVPAEIKRLKDGRLSTDKSQKTVLPILLKAIEENAEPRWKFEDFISALEEKGWSQFFFREESPRNISQLENYEQRVQIIFEEMREALHDPHKAYPSPGPIKCPTCPFLQICASMEEGGDYQYLLNVSYKKHAKTPWTLPPRFRDMTG